MLTLKCGHEDDRLLASTVSVKFSIFAISSYHFLLSNIPDTMVAPPPSPYDSKTGSGSVRRRRKAPFPNSILDRRALVQTLEDRNLMISPFHITAFYAALHRQHYPDLPTFVANYYKFENGETSSGPTVVRPLKNRVSTKKNRNKSQLPRKFLDFLQEDAQSSGFVTVTSRIEFAQTSADRSTTKLAVQLHDGQLVESVLMRYVSTATSNNSRASLCVSSQCGCAMGCTFCATGTMGLSGNLTAGEILEQIVHADALLADEWQQMQQKDGLENKENSDDGTDISQISQQPLPKLDLVRNVVRVGHSWLREFDTCGLSVLGPNQHVFEFHYFRFSWAWENHWTTTAM
jgi:hypothetical protein